MSLRIVLAIALLLGCEETPPRATDPIPTTPWTEPTRAAALRLATHLEGLDGDPAAGLTALLAFEAPADLDLYVSDPLSETIYYANTPARSGGRLLRDVHCKSAVSGVRIEEISFEDPPAGPYRIGVDYPQRCEPGQGAVAYVLHVRERGERREIRGVIEPLTFLPFLVEIEVAP